MLSHVTSDLTGFENLLGLDRVYLNEINKSNVRTLAEEKKCLNQDLQNLRIYRIRQNKIVDGIFGAASL